MNEAVDAIQEAIERHAKECCGHLDMDGRAGELLAELEQRGWKLVQVDPFAPGPSNEWFATRLAAALDTFRDAAEAHGYYRTEGSAREARDAYQAMLDARVALVRVIVGDRPEASADGCPICEGMCCGHGTAAPDVLTDRQGVLDAFANRLTVVEDRFDALFDSDGRPAADTWLYWLSERVDQLENRR